MLRLAYFSNTLYNHYTKANIDENKYRNFIKMISQTIKNIENKIKKQFPEITPVDLKITTSEENVDS